MRFISTSLTPTVNAINPATPQIGQYVASAQGPASATDCANTALTLISFVAPMISGQRYLVTARYQGLIVTANPGFINAQLNDSLGLILPGTAYIISLSSAAYQVGNYLAGGISTEIRAVTSTNNTFTLGVQTSGAGALRTQPNSAEIVVVRIL